MDKNQSRLIVGAGFLIVLIQHFCIILVPFIIPDLTVQVFYIDIIGFFIIGLGYILVATDLTDKKNLYFGSGGFLIGWVVFTLIWRFITKFYEITINAANTDATLTNFFQQVANERLLFSSSTILASLFLFVGSLFIYKAHGGAGAILLVVFALLNFIGMLLIAGPAYLAPDSTTDASNLAMGVIIGLILKIILVPIMGLVAFLVLVLKTNDVVKTSNVVKKVEEA